jgi:hypothetical protein
LLVPAVERCITIVCIALNNALTQDTPLTAGMQNTGRAILYGNHLIKSDGHEDTNVLWNVIQTEIPVVKGEVGKVLREQNVISKYKKD